MATTPLRKQDTPSEDDFDFSPLVVPAPLPREEIRATVEKSVADAVAGKVVSFDAIQTRILGARRSSK